MKIIPLCIPLFTLTLASNGHAEVNWSEIERAKRYGNLTLKEQQRIGLIETGLRPDFPLGVDCPKVSSPFGSPTRYDGSLRVQRSNNGRHGGMDISLDDGTPLLAVADGTVIHIDRGGRLVGNVIWMQHAPEETGFGVWIYTKYQHLDRRPDLRVGGKIKAGEVVAVSGSTGTIGGYFGGSGYPHLHMNAYASPSRKYKITSRGVKIKHRIYIDPVAFYMNDLFKGDQLKRLPGKQKLIRVGVKLKNGSMIPKETRKVWPVYCEST